MTHWRCGGSFVAHQTSGAEVPEVFFLKFICIPKAGWDAKKLVVKERIRPKK